MEIIIGVIPVADSDDDTLELMAAGIATRWLDRPDLDAAAAQLAINMLHKQSAILIHTERGRARLVRLVSADDDTAAAPIDLAAINCEPAEPSEAGIERRMWFFARLGYLHQDH